MPLTGICQSLSPWRVPFCLSCRWSLITSTKVRILSNNLVLTEYEAHNDVNTASGSLVLKLFFWKFFTVGIIPLISKIYLYVKVPFTNIEFELGRYDDITPQWYPEVGIGLVISSIVKIALIAVVGAANYGIYKFKIWHDQK